MKFGGLFLGASCAFLVAGTAGAADLPARRTAPVDYVRVCDYAGTGYFYVPGTDTCIQVGGLVRAEGLFVNNARQYYPTATFGQASALVPAGTTITGRGEDSSGFLARGRIAVDTRTQTSYGTVRAYVRYQIDRDQGLYAGGGSAGGANTFANQGGNNAYLDKGFIQFAGITAGRVQSFFDFYADTYNYEGIANSDLSTNAFAYTYQAGGGVAATLALESHEARTDGVGSIAGGVAQGAGYGGSELPDIVSQLNVTQAWGAAQLSAAYHQVNTVGTAQGFGETHKDADGFAVQGGMQLKLPMLAAGDEVWLEGAYQNGAYLYQDSAAYMNAGFQSRFVGGFQHIDHDAIAIPDAGGGSYGLAVSRGFSTMVAFHHYFTATFHDVLFGSYEQSSYGRAKNIDWTLGGLGDASQYRVGNQFLWDPIRNLEVGLEFDYAHIDQTLAHNPGQAATALPVGISKNPDAFEARLRIERDF